MMQDPLLNSGEMSMEHMLVPNPSRPSSSSSPNILQQSPVTDNQRPRGKPNTSNSDQQALKCPRCESTNTKFCYYNNYSSQQPRHFCKNCRRYWTHGGALRNVPPGGGCRKNKRAKQRLAGLDVDGTSDLLAANLHNGCSPLLPNFAFPGSTLNDEHNRMLRFALSASSQDQPMIRLRDESCRGFSSNLFDDLQGVAASSLPAYPSLMHMASSFDHHGLFNNMGAAAIKAEPEAILPYHGCGEGRCDLGFQDASSVMQISGSATATIASFEEQLSSFSNDSLESELRTQQQAKLPVHFSADEMFMPSSLNMNVHDTKALNGLLDGQNDWQQQTAGASLDESVFDSHNHTCHTSRWLDQMQSRTSTNMASAMH